MGMSEHMKRGWRRVRSAEGRGNSKHKDELRLRSAQVNTSWKAKVAGMWGASGEKRWG